MRLVKTVRVSAAVGHVQQALGALTGDEAGSLAAFMTRALERGLDARHTPLALSAADILEYLPFDSFVPGATSWKELRDELTRSTGSVASGSQFKRWLESAKRADLSDDAVERATRKLSAVPQEMTHLMNQIRDVLDSPSTE